MLADALGALEPRLHCQKFRRLAGPPVQYLPHINGRDGKGSHAATHFLVRREKKGVRMERTPSQYRAVRLGKMTTRPPTWSAYSVPPEDDWILAGMGVNPGYLLPSFAARRLCKTRSPARGKTSHSVTLRQPPPSPDATRSSGRSRAALPRSAPARIWLHRAFEIRKEPVSRRQEKRGAAVRKYHNHKGKSVRDNSIEF